MVMRLRSLADAVAAAASRSLPDAPRVDPPAAELGPAVAVDEIASDRLLVSREVASARARAHAFADFLIVDTQAHGIPLDESLPHIDFWMVFVEAFGLAYLHWPYAFPEPSEAEDEALAHGYAPLNDAEAYAHGLSVAKCRNKRERIAATLPGCQGKLVDGRPCDRLRRKGERFCPGHRASALRQLRGL
jgi:hypothetical protein